MTEPRVLDATEALAAAKGVRLVLLDVDGVLTDGRLFLSDSGEELKVFHSRDGHGIKMLLATGVGVGLVTGRHSQAVQHRARDLGITIVVQGCRDKRAAVERLLEEHNVMAHEVAFMGDDVIDLPAMESVGLAVAVADAHPLVRARAQWVTEQKGGHGAVRAFCELVMHAQGTLEHQLGCAYRGECPWAGG
ncbi:3-deoxy-manno-octulosonate-8-phosphatase KdsC [Acidiferrobacter sp.]|uniref:3-deoxy-manno-octulosonate-8-phosphatase KdsC n=1 Tax=Acidiferrobacter sp. TaxID=1872107 RepID=UPI002637D730|nr:3-deoxy-manno-octulosonate-8-phosphatase KdsC [Acidiferrobacter sp.]